MKQFSLSLPAEFLKIKVLNYKTVLDGQSMRKAKSSHCFSCKTCKQAVVSFLLQLQIKMKQLSSEAGMSANGSKVALCTHSPGAAVSQSSPSQ